jgi:hypothetical protein
MKLDQAITPETAQELSELKLKHIVAAGSVAAAALTGGSTTGNPHYVDKGEQQSEIKRQSFKSFAAKVDARARTLATAITDKYAVGTDFAVKVAKLAIKHEAATFPKAEDILAVVGIESSFKPHAASKLAKDPAVGLMQVRPGVWGLDPNKLKASAEEQIKVGSKILHDYYQKLKSKEAALQAYNVGLTNYMKKKGLNPRYVPKFDDERDMYEGMMKRSDPYISGEREGPRPPAKKVSAYAKRLQALADKAHKPLADIEAMWREEVAKVDPKHPNRFGVVMNRLKQRLGLSS